jgi:hypothetical protein
VDVGRISGSICRPSRGPTSTISTFVPMDADRMQSVYRKASAR